MWHRHVLEGCRNGTETEEVYNFVHGFSTQHVGSWLPETDAPVCANAGCVALQDDIWPEMFKNHASWEDMVDGSEAEDGGFLQDELIKSDIGL